MPTGRSGQHGGVSVTATLDGTRDTTTAAPVFYGVAVRVEQERNARCDGSVAASFPNGPPSWEHHWHLPWSELFDTIISTLQQLGGSARSREALDAIHERVRHRLVPRDYQMLSDRSISWERRCQRAVQQLVLNGQMLQPTHRNVWELTETGLRHLPEDTRYGEGVSADHVRQRQLSSAANARIDQSNLGWSNRNLGVPALDFEVAIVRYLQEQEGSTPQRAQVLNAMWERLGHNFQEHDLEEESVSGRARWEGRFNTAYQRLRKTGMLSLDTPRGVWALTSQGMLCEPDTIRSPNVDVEVTTSQSFQSPIVAALLQLGGTAPVSIPLVVDTVYTYMRDQMLPDDFLRLPSGKVAWHQRARQAYLSLSEIGITDDSTPRGLWRLTEWALGLDEPHSAGT